MPVRVIIDSPQKNSSIIYASGYTCLDNVITIDIDGDVTGFFPATEYERAKKISKCNTVINLSEQLENLDITALKKPAAVIVKVDKGSRADLGRPTTTPNENKQNFMKFIQSQLI